MPGDTHRAPLSSWSRPVVVATVLAYRRSMGEQPRAPVADRAAHAAFLAADGDPELAARDVVLIVAAAARDHPDWFWRPARERIAREERWWKARGVWPPLKDRSGWPAGLQRLLPRFCPFPAGTGGNPSAIQLRPGRGASRSRRAISRIRVCGLYCGLPGLWPRKSRIA